VHGRKANDGSGRHLTTWSALRSTEGTTEPPSACPYVTGLVKASCLEAIGPANDPGPECSPPTIETASSPSPHHHDTATAAAGGKRRSDCPLPPTLRARVNCTAMAASARRARALPSAVSCSTRCNTPCYSSPNPSLITIISSLVMHYMP
jgi:hypothetical protein